MRRLIYVTGFLMSMFYGISGFAAAVFEMVTGDVRTGATTDRASAARKDQRIDPGSVVVTGPKSRALLRFDDGQAVALHENTEFKVSEYSYGRCLHA